MAWYALGGLCLTALGLFGWGYVLRWMRLRGFLRLEEILRVPVARSRSDGLYAFSMSDRPHLTKTLTLEEVAERKRRRAEGVPKQKHPDAVMSKAVRLQIHELGLVSEGSDVRGPLLEVSALEDIDTLRRSLRIHQARLGRSRPCYCLGARPFGLEFLMENGGVEYPQLVRGSCLRGIGWDYQVAILTKDRLMFWWARHGLPDTIDR